ncbi:hypothetical protein MBLNU230_g3506t1 [Neophaeotheca triangularis]
MAPLSQSQTKRSGDPRAQGGNWSLAGPHSRAQMPHRWDPHNTYVEEGYEDANPWMKEQQKEPEFSLAGTFPRTVRFTRKRGTKDDVKAVNPAEKGQSEEAPQVAFAQEEAEEDASSPHESVDSTGTTDVEEDNNNNDNNYNNEGQSRPNPQRSQTADTTTMRERQIKSVNRKTGKPKGQIASEHTPEEDPAVRPYNHWAYVRRFAQRPLAEWLGTVIFTFLGVSANVVVKAQDPPGNIQTSYWTWGFALMLAIYIAGGGSGGFVNPAIAIMLSILRGFPPKRLPAYILAQILGAFVGALLAYAVYQDTIRHFDNALVPSSTGTAFYTQPRDWIQPGTAFVTELLGTAVLGCAIIALGDSGNSPPGAGMHAFIIGLLLVVILMSLGYNTGGCFNPARDLGPRLAVLVVGYPTSTFTAYHNWWIWGTWGADILGACTGALLYDVCIFKGGESPVNYSFGRWKVEGKKEQTGWLHLFGKHKKAQNAERDLESGVAARRKKGKQDPSD